MSILTDCYIFKRVATKSKTRLDCVASTESYPEFEERRAAKKMRTTEKRDGINIGDLLCYFGKNNNIKCDHMRKSEISISMGSKNLSSVYVPDPSNNFAFGDVNGTADALLFVSEGLNLINGEIQAGAILKVFVARGKSKDRVPLYNLLSDGGLDDEMADLQDRAVTKSVTLNSTGDEAQK